MSEAAQEFSGVYVAHWEVPRFCVVKGRKLFGLLPRVERWQAHLPESVVSEHTELLPGRHGGARYFKMRVLGRLGEPGHFGHMGICSRELFVSEVLEMVPTDNPGPTW